MNTISVIDAAMGSGKTTLAHSIMNQDHEKAVPASFNQEGSGIVREPKYIFVSPYLDEIQKRLPAACPALDFREPEIVEHNGVRHPKWLHLQRLLCAGHNIATTHALLPFLTPRGLTAIREQGYKLIIDEALDSTQIHRILTENERDYLLRQHMISVDQNTGKVEWRYNDTGHRFEDVERLSRTGSLFLSEDKFLIWEFPQEALEAFQEITILTYLFEGSTLAAYLRTYGFQYHLLGIKNGRPVPLRETTEVAAKAQWRSLLTVYEGPKNEVGDLRPKGGKSGQRFTKTNLDGWKPQQWKRMGQTVGNFLRRDARVTSKQVGWTTFRNHSEKIAANTHGFKKAEFIPVNTRATNEYRDKTVMIYLANRYANPALSRFIETKGESFDDDLFALSEMIQWIWRGCIRDWMPMTVFIPSERMRNLLVAWLETNTMEELKARLTQNSGAAGRKAA